MDDDQELLLLPPQPHAATKNERARNGGKDDALFQFSCTFGLFSGMGKLKINYVLYFIKYPLKVHVILLLFINLKENNYQLHHCNRMLKYLDNKKGFFSPPCPLQSNISLCTQEAPSIFSEL